MHVLLECVCAPSSMRDLHMEKQNDIRGWGSVMREGGRDRVYGVGMGDR